MPQQKNRLVPRIAAAALAAGLAAGAAAPAAAQLVPLYPDACTSSLTPGKVATAVMTGSNTTVHTTPGALAGEKLVMLINGNGYATGSYSALADHLARNGFITAIFHRPGNAASVSDLFDEIDLVLAYYGIAQNDPDLDIALVGHSMGGRVAIDAARSDYDNSLGYPIRAVATLAPVASTTSLLDGWSVAGYLSLYGSQDEDVDAYIGSVNEAFFAYDNAGTESSTTCNTPPCTASSPAFQKTMVFAYGADHAGLVGVGISGAIGQPQGLDYLAPADTLCITKAYVTGFLRLHLWGDTVYKGMLRGEWKPASVAAIDTAEADGFGNPAGSPLRLFFQISPAQHKTIQSFAGGLGTYTVSPSVVVQHAVAGANSGSPFYVRHDTDYAAVGWDGTSIYPWVRFAVPSGSRDGSTYTHFSLRIGQMEGMSSPYDNPVNTDQSVWVGFEDVGGAIDWHLLGGIPAPDRYTDAGPIQAQSHLSTRRIAVSAITGIDLTDIRGIRLSPLIGTHGTLLVDSLEWHRE